MSATPMAQRGPWYDAADLGCAGLGIGLSVASVRLFANGSAVLTLCGVALGSWGLASALRRTRLPGWLADVAQLGIGVWLLLMLAAPMNRWGPLPTPGSVQAISDAIGADFGRFDEDVAPLVAGTGHLVVMGTLVWILGLFNSTGAMRLRAPVQAMIPHLVAFVGLGFVARGSGRFVASVAMLASVGLYALTQIAWRNAASRWLPRTSHVAARSLATGAGILAVAAVVTAMVAPLLPGSADPVVDLRRGGLGEGGPRTVVSPFVEVGSNLGPRSDDLLFTVEAPSAQYWRLTALDTYDEDKAIWVLSNSYEAVDSELEPGARATDAARLDVRGLGGIWVPAPEAPVTAEADFGLNWDGGAQSLIRRSGNLAEGDVVDFGTAEGLVDGSGVTPDPGWLRVAPPADRRGELTDEKGAPPELRALAVDLSGGRSAYEGLLAIQDHFREGFGYDETIDLSGEADPLVAFLALRRGFCQQFSTAFALAARSIGYPTRVVVGFTAGDEVGEGSDDRSVFAVRGRHAHAWPEVRFEGVGWVPFEPTPGRGNPATTDITGVPGAQAAPPADEPLPEDLPTTTATPSTAAPGSEGPPTTAASVEGVDPGESADSADPDAGGGPGANRAWWILVAGAAVALSSGAVLAVVRRQRFRRGSDRDPVAAQWRLALRDVAKQGLTMADSETPDEFARRCDTGTGMPAMIVLAELESTRRWSTHGTSDSDAQQARQARESVTVRVGQLRSGSSPASSPMGREPVGQGTR